MAFDQRGCGGIYLHGIGRTAKRKPDGTERLAQGDAEREDDC